MNRQNEKLYKVVITGLMAALCYVAFTFLKIPIPTFGGDMTALHIGNAFCVLAALLLGGWYGGLAGSLGMTIADILDPVYITSAPKTFILKLCIGLIAGFVAHKIAHITDDHDQKYIFKWSLIASVAGLGFNGSSLHGSTPGIEKGRTVFPYLRKTGNARRKIYGFRGNSMDIRKKGFLLSKKWCIITETA